MKRNSENLDDFKSHQANLVKNCDVASNQFQDNVNEITSLKDSRQSEQQFRSYQGQIKAE